MTTTTTTSCLSAVEMARLLCQEARVVLTSLRGGPPHIARGELAQDLMELRDRIPLDLERSLIIMNNNNNNNSSTGTFATAPAAAESGDDNNNNNANETGAEKAPPALVSEEEQASQSTTQPATQAQQPQQRPTLTPMTPTLQSSMDLSRPFLAVVTDPRASGPHTAVALQSIRRLLQHGALLPTEQVMEGILGCKFEQTNAGQDEAVEMAICDVLGQLVALACTVTTAVGTGTGQEEELLLLSPETIHSALDTVFGTRQTFGVHSPALGYHLDQVLIQMVEACCGSGSSGGGGSGSVATTRVVLEFLLHQLLHTPLSAAEAAAQAAATSSASSSSSALGPSPPPPPPPSSSMELDDAGRESQAAHDATRVLCLRLVRMALESWPQHYHHHHSGRMVMGGNGGDDENDKIRQQQQREEDYKTHLLPLIQDDLCLSLLMTGQAIWHYQTGSGGGSSGALYSSPTSGGGAGGGGSNNLHFGSGNSSAPSLVSPAVLTEICATICFLWNSVALRPHLMGPFQAIWTGFYTRSLCLLRRRREAVHAAAYHANLLFDAELEIILESLTDLLNLHDPQLPPQQQQFHHQQDQQQVERGALETMFVHYDCHLHRPDVAVGLYVELCRACGGVVNEEGSSLVSSATNTNNNNTPGTNNHNHKDGDKSGSVASSLDDHGPGGPGAAVDRDDLSLSAASSTGDPTTSLVQVDHPWRPVPAHLKELCAAAIMGGMKCLFQEDKASPQTLIERANRNRSILASSSPVAAGASSSDELQYPNDDNDDGEAYEDHEQQQQQEETNNTTSHLLRTIKSQKRFMRKAARIFNKKASRGIEFLVDCGLLTEPVTPLQVATFLRHAIVVGLDKAAVGSYLGEVGKASPSSSSKTKTSSSSSTVAASAATKTTSTGSAATASSASDTAARLISMGPPVWERDWFHKECLEAYCGLFSFQDQSLLDSLRMFLAAFRLPGEAQQIDRILQAFADQCAALCQEAATSPGSLSLFSKDPKRASDAAYLLSFSIIMLNTDQHNANIRADRKMTVDDFVRNNTDYGKDITEPGKELPREYLVSIYDSIREEEIRTEGEGAEGAMTVERWKDVLRQAAAAAAHASSAQAATTSTLATAHTTLSSMVALDPVAILSTPSRTDADDLTELVLDHVWKPILSAIGAFWNVSGRFPAGSGQLDDVISPPTLANGVSGGLAGSGGGSNTAANHHAVMLGVQGARLGMDMSLAMLYGVRQLGRIDIFRKIFAWVCDYTGLLSGASYSTIQYYYASGGGGGGTTTGAAVTTALVDSVEAQSAVVVAIRTAIEAGQDLDLDGWKRMWAILLELRDAHLLPAFLLRESEADLLRRDQRREWNEATLEGDMTDIVADEFANNNPNSPMSGESRHKKTASKPTTMLGAFGRALFGSDEPEEPARPRRRKPTTGKEDTVIWDQLAPSDDEMDQEDVIAVDGEDGNKTDDYQRPPPPRPQDSLEAEFGEDIAHLSPGAVFEAQLIRESMDMDQHMETPVTGLERAEDTYQRSPRARLRNRFQQSCPLEGFISDSRFLDDESIKQALMGLMDLIPTGPPQSQQPQQQPIVLGGGKPTEIMATTPARLGMGERSMSDVSISTPSFAASSNWSIPVSPASEAFAEVLICEIALKNRDRLKMLWTDLLHEHYVGRLSKLLTAEPVEPNPDEEEDDDVAGIIEPDPGLEKRITGLIRLSVCCTAREDCVNEILSAWRDVLPIAREQQAQLPFRAMHRHLSEGLWRIVSHASDGLLNLDESGWEGLMSLFDWCATRSCSLPRVRPQAPSLAEDDAAVQTYRCLHLLLNSADLEKVIPVSIIDSLRTLVAAGDTRNYPQLSVASLDLLQLLNQKKIAVLNENVQELTDLFCSTCWRRTVEAMAEAAEHPRISNVRQHALSMLTDLFLDRQNALVPIPHLCGALTQMCVPLAGRCIVSMQMGRGPIPSSDEFMIEFELCIGLIFKPLRHHLKNALEGYFESHVFPLWKAVLAVLEELLAPASSDERRGVPETLQNTMQDLATEHLQNAIIMLVSSGIFVDPKSEISTTTQISVLRMGIKQKTLDAWLEKGTESTATA